MGKTHCIHDWEEWKEICERQEIDPYERADFSLDLGGGDSFDVEYAGSVPKKRKEDVRLPKEIKEDKNEVALLSAH